MVAGGRDRIPVAHQIRHNDTDAALLVVKHDRGAASLTNAQFQWPVWVLIIERHAFQVITVFYIKIVVIEKDHVSGRLSGNAFANGAVASVVVYWIVIGMGVHMFAPPCIFV